ncbi:hypothetical protein BDZ91DRAFT_710249 [Kalaharituber pfeilii]|nr:hypothetical protein BDZ91DRAFT_710249 [Kalaharituber pfeilii]
MYGLETEVAGDQEAVREPPEGKEDGRDPLVAMLLWAGLLEAYFFHIYSINLFLFFPLFLMYLTSP